MNSVSNPVPEAVARRILNIRGQKVMLDSDLAELYGVATKRLNEQVRRNSERFPEDFMFQLNAEESGALRSQIATLNAGRGQHRKYLPYAFTEHGEIMAATVLNSPRAVDGRHERLRRARLRPVARDAFRTQGTRHPCRGSRTENRLA